MAYFSKWRDAWIDFPRPPDRGELMALRKYHYRIAVDGKEVPIDELIKNAPLHA